MSEPGDRSAYREVHSMTREIQRKNFQFDILVNMNRKTWYDSYAYIFFTISITPIPRSVIE